MRIDVSYIRDNKVCHVNQLKTDDIDNVDAFIKKKVAEVIKKHGYYNVKVSVMYDIRDPHVRRVIVDNCRPTTIGKVTLCNLNLDDVSDLGAIERHINYLYKDQTVSADTIQALLNDVFTSVIKMFLLVKNISIFLSLDKASNVVNVVCYCDLASVNYNYILNTSVNLDAYKHKVSADIAAIYSHLVTERQMTFHQLVSQLKRYMSKHSYVKRVAVFLRNEADKQIVDVETLVRILSHFAIHNNVIRLLDNNGVFYMANVGLVDGNILNTLYFRLFGCVYKQKDNRVVGLNLRYKILLGYKKVLYIGLNYYPVYLYDFSDVNAVLKFKHLFGANICLISRLSLRWLFVSHKLGLTYLYPSLIVGARLNNIKVLLHFFELVYANCYFVGFKMSIYSLSALLKRVTATVGLYTYSATGAHNSSTILSVADPVALLDIAYGNTSVALKLILTPVNKFNYDNLLFEASCLANISNNLQCGFVWIVGQRTCQVPNALVEI